MVQTISIFLITIMNKNLLISFILSQLEDFAVEVENYRLDYLQDDLENENPIFTNKALSWPNNLAQLADNFVLSNKEKNLVNRFKRDSIYEFNLSSREPSPRRLPLSPCHNTEANAVSKWDIPNIKHVGTRISGFNMICHKVKNSFGFQLYKWQAAIILNILKRVNVVVQADTSLGKSLPFQANPIVKIGAIIFVVSPMMTLIED